MTQQTVDVPALFERAGRQAAATAAAVRPDQLALPTPCAEWNVQQLLDHIAGSASYLHAAVEGRTPQDPKGVAPGEVAKRLDDTLDAVGRPGALETVCRSPLGFDWTVGEAMAGTFMDLLIHEWDLARATGQPTTMDPELAAACEAMFLPEMPERGRAGGLVGPAVPVPPDVGPVERLLCAMGRTP